MVTHLRKHDGCRTGMIARSRLLLFIAGLMFLIDDNQAQPLEGQEYCRAGSQYHIVGIIRQLFLPYLYTFSIRIARMIDAEAVAEDSLQSLHHLYRQCYLGQQIEHLFLALKGPLYEVDVYLGLAAAGHTVQQRNLLLHHRHQNGIVRILLSSTQRLHQVGTIGATVVKASYFELVGLKHLALLQLLQRFGRGTAGIHQFLTSHRSLFPRLLSILIPPRQFQVTGKSLQLLAGP